MPRFSIRPLAALAASAVLATGAVAFNSPEVAHAAASPDGLYHPSYFSHRLLDTRQGHGSVGVGQTVTISPQTFSSASVPLASAQAVVVNITVTGTTGPGYAVAYSGSTVPSTSNINFTKGWTGASMATVAVNAGAGLTIRVGGGKGTRAQIIVDLQGWYANSHYDNGITGGGLVLPDKPTRFFDSRSQGGKLPGGYYQEHSFDWGTDPKGGTPLAVLINLTATGSSGPGNLSAWEGDESEWPTTSSVNFGKGETSPNTAIVPLRSLGGGRFGFGIANTGNYQTDYLIDLLGVYVVGDTLDPSFKHVVVAPKRVMNFATVGPQRTVTATIPSSMGDQKRTAAFEGTLTAVTPSTTSYETAWGSGSRPGVSSLNVVSGKTRSNGILTQWDAGPSTVSVYNNAGTIKGIVDITGRFDAIDVSAATAGRSAVFDRLRAMSTSAAPAAGR